MGWFAQILTDYAQKLPSIGTHHLKTIFSTELTLKGCCGPKWPTVSSILLLV